MWVMTGAAHAAMLRRRRAARRSYERVVEQRQARKHGSSARALPAAAAGGRGAGATDQQVAHLRSAEARTPSRRSRRVRSTRFRHWPAARRISRPSRVCAGRVRSRVAILKSSKRSLMPIVFAGVALARQVAGELRAQVGEDRAELVAVAHRVQVAVEGGLAADRLRLARGHHRPLVAAVRGGVQPGAEALAEVLDQERRLGGGDVADRLDAERRRASPPPSGRCR